MAQTSTVSFLIPESEYTHPPSTVLDELNYNDTIENMYRNDETPFRGSDWAKWDLHVHTPYSFVHNYSGDSATVWEEFLLDLEKLPEEFKVLGINDYLFIDGYERLVQEKSAGRLKNIELLIPVIEFRLSKFGGTESSLAKVNFHIIFSPELTPKQIKEQFLSVLSASYRMSPQYESFQKIKRWSASPTLDSLKELGSLILETVPADRLHEYKDALTEGFNNFTLEEEKIRQALSGHIFENRYLTAVGKTEWASIKWNDQSIADKKTVINDADMVFISSDSVENLKRNRDVLKDSNVNSCLLDCSDAHSNSVSNNKDRIGKCFTWLKAEYSFEGLKQVIYEPEYRLFYGEHSPEKPLYTIDSVDFSFPDDATFFDDKKFCLEGLHNLYFSNNLTCLIGGRGVGKSTTLNLIADCVNRQKGLVFSSATSSSLKVTSKPLEDCIKILPLEIQKDIEIIEQNEIVEYATKKEKFTQALYSRILKYDGDISIEDLAFENEKALGRLRQQIECIGILVNLKKELDNNIKTIDQKKKIVDSIKSEVYRAAAGKSKQLSIEIERLNVLKQRFSDLTSGVATVLEDTILVTLPDESRNEFEEKYYLIYAELQEYYKKLEGIDLQALDEKIANLVSEKQQTQKEISEFFATQSISREDLNDLSKAGEVIAQLQREQGDLIARIKHYEDIKVSYNPQVITDSSEKYVDTIKSVVNSVQDIVNSDNNEYVNKISISYSFDEERALDYFINRFQELLYKGRIDVMRDIFHNIDLKNIQNKESLIEGLTTQLVRPPQKILQDLIDLLSIDENFEIMNLISKEVYLDVKRFMVLGVQYGDKSLENSSFGQRCTAVIVLLLSLGNTPIIIDEPEAHLDSSLIANYLVDIIKRKKQFRQIIFATHNANFVVNGDAELIYILDNSSGTTTFTPTTIENLTHRDKLLNLEGGIQAFRQRGYKYKISI